MTSSEYDQMVTEYTEKRMQGMSYSEMKEQIRSLNLDQTKSRHLLSDVDDLVIQSMTQARSLPDFNLRKLGGAALFLFSSTITLYSLFSAHGIMGYYVVWGGGIVGGLYMYLSARSQEKRAEIEDSPFRDSWDRRRRHRL